MSNGNRSQFITLVFIIVITAFLSALITRQLTPANSGSIEKAVGEFIINNPQQVADALQKAFELEQKKADEEAIKNVASKRDELENDAGSPFIGNAKGGKILVEFFDYNCGYCKRMLPTLNALIKEDPEVKVVFKELPILGSGSEIASKVSLAVFKKSPEKYWAFHSITLTEGARSEEQVYAAVQKAGLNVKDVKALAESSDIAAQLQKHLALADAVGVRGTPGFVANGKLLRGAQEKADLLNAFN